MQSQTTIVWLSLAHPNGSTFNMDSKLAYKKQSVMHKYFWPAESQQCGNKVQQKFPYIE